MLVAFDLKDGWAAVGWMLRRDVWSAARRMFRATGRGWNRWHLSGLYAASSG